MLLKFFRLSRSRLVLQPEYLNGAVCAQISTEDPVQRGCNMASATLTTARESFVLQVAGGRDLKLVSLGFGTLFGRVGRALVRPSPFEVGVAEPVLDHVVGDAVDPTL
jgi:hypothetical protein